MPGKACSNRQSAIKLTQQHWPVTFFPSLKTYLLWIIKRKKWRHQCCTRVPLLWWARGGEYLKAHFSTGDNMGGGCLSLRDPVPFPSLPRNICFLERCNLLFFSRTGLWWINKALHHTFLVHLWTFCLSRLILPAMIKGEGQDWQCVLWY